MNPILDEDNDTPKSWSIADFEIRETVLGKGLLGTVYHGRFKRKRTTMVNGELERDVAIKVMDRTTIMKKQEFIDMVMNERRILSSFSSSSRQHVIKLYLSFIDIQNLFMVMELCSCDLAQLVKCRGSNSDYSVVDCKTRDEVPVFLDFTSVQYLSAQLVMALEEIHSKNCIHCDLKPENILIKNNGWLKLTDFATARIIPSCPAGSGEKSKNTKCHYLFIGTADYLAPEVLLDDGNETPSVYQDLWSFGCIMYYMFVGQSPFHTQSDCLTFQKIYNYAMNMDTSVPFSPSIPTVAMDLISQLLSILPSQRTKLDSVAVSVTDEQEETRTDTKQYEDIRGHSFFCGIQWHILGDIVKPPDQLSERLRSYYSIYGDETFLDGSNLPFDFF